MPKPACVRCQCFYRPKKNGQAVIEGMPTPMDGEATTRDGPEIRGRRQPGAWQPYKLWIADLWECPDCGHELIAGWATGPLLEHYQPEFNAEALARRPCIQINDC